jgi:hypothetical protein
MPIRRPIKPHPVLGQIKLMRSKPQRPRRPIGLVGATTGAAMGATTGAAMGTTTGAAIGAMTGAATGAALGAETGVGAVIGMAAGDITGMAAGDITGAATGIFCGAAAGDGALKSDLQTVPSGTPATTAENGVNDSGELVTFKLPFMASRKSIEYTIFVA